MCAFFGVDCGLKSRHQSVDASADRIAGGQPCECLMSGNGGSSSAVIKIACVERNPLDRGRLVETLWEWNEWVNVRIIAYSVPAVQLAWVRRELLTRPGQVEPAEGFIGKGTEVWCNKFADPSNVTMIVQGPGGSELTAFPMAVRVIGRAEEDQEPIIKVSGAGGWSGWTLKKSLLLQEPDAGQ